MGNPKQFYFDRQVVSGKVNKIGLTWLKGGMLERLKTKVKTCSLVLIPIVMTTSCSLMHPNHHNVAEYENLHGPVPALGNVEFYTHKLASELFTQTRPASQSSYAVVGFTPLPKQTYDDDMHHPLQLLGHQLKEGLITEATKRGYTTQEFLLAGDINVTESADSVLTRNVDRLTNVHRVDFLITGTVMHQERGAIVNARIVQSRTQEVIAAATTFVPAELFWQRERATVRNGRLMRKQSELSVNE